MCVMVLVGVVFGIYELNVLIVGCVLECLL